MPAGPRRRRHAAVSRARVFEVDPSRPEASPEAVEAAAAALRKGALVVLPTETVYGIAARPDDPDATARLFAAKQRSASLSLPVLARDAKRAWALGTRTDDADALARAFWPGPLTLVVERTTKSARWALGDRPRTIGLRVPDHQLAQALLGRAGPFAATSANLSGRAPLSGRDELVAAFGDLVAVYLVTPPGSAGPSGLPSTVIDLTASTPAVSREGGVPTAAILRVVSNRDRGRTL